MKITDEMVAKAIEAHQGFVGEYGDRYPKSAMKTALAAALASKEPGFCTATLNCRLADGHEGVCAR